MVTRCKQQMVNLQKPSQGQLMQSEECCQLIIILQSDFYNKNIYSRSVVDHFLWWNAPIVVVNSNRKAKVAHQAFVRDANRTYRNMENQHRVSIATLLQHLWMENATVAMTGAFWKDLVRTFRVGWTLQPKKSYN